MPNATIQLLATPASAGTPQFSFGCGSGNGTSACNLGTVDAGSAQRQLQAQLAVPATATVTSVSLTVTGSASGMLTAPQASAVVSLSASAGATPTLPGGLLPGATTSSPGGSAVGLFPTVEPTSPSGVTEGTSQVASTSPLSGDHLTVQLAGLAALFVAFLLAVTRVSIRRPAPSAALPPDGAAVAGPSGVDEPTRELGGIGEPAPRSRGVDSARRLRVLSDRGRRAQAQSGARHRRK